MPYPQTTTYVKHRWTCKTSLYVCMWITHKSDKNELHWHILLVRFVEKAVRAYNLLIHTLYNYHSHWFYSICMAIWTIRICIYISLHQTG